MALNLLVAIVLLVLVGCSPATDSREERPVREAAGIAGDVGSTPSGPPPTLATSTEPAPFTADDLEDLVLAPDEGHGLVQGLSYANTYSGTADIGDVRHWTLAPTEPLQAAGFVEAYAAMFMTPAFPGTFATEGRDLATAALLFETSAGAHDALLVFSDSRDEAWEEWRPLPTRSGFGTVGLLGSDNVSVVYPTVGIMSRVGNVIVMVGSQGGSDEGRPLPVRLVRRIAYDLRDRAREALDV